MRFQGRLDLGLALAVLVLSAAGSVASSSVAATNATSTNLTTIVDTLLSDLGGLVTCAACETVLLVLKLLSSLGDAAFVDTITSICVLAKLEDDDVCRGAIGLEGPIIAHDLRGMVIPSHTAQLFCNTIIGLCDYPPVRPYTVAFPKPKPNTTRPAVSGQPPLQVVHFSDIHIDREYDPGSSWNCTKPICCRDYDAAAAPGNTSYPCGPHGDHHCDTPETLAESMYAAIGSLAPNASFAIFTGDVPEHAVWLDDKPIVTVSLQDAYATLHEQLRIPLYATAGNHDSGPVNSFPPAAVQGAPSVQWAYDILSSAWEPWIGNASATQADEYAAYSYLVPDSNLRVISLDTNFYYITNFWLFEPVMEYDPNGQLAWLVQELQAAEDAGERVWIIGHMAFGLSDALRDGSHYLNQIVNRYDATIAAMFFGHTHVDEFEISYSDYTAQSADTAVMVSYIAPSLTPTSGSPAFRVYSIDPVTYAVLDFTEYTTSLEAADFQTAPPVWGEYYSAKNVYGPLGGVTDAAAELTPAFWHDVTAAFETDDAAFQGYIARKSRGWNVGSCTGSCKTNEICQLRAAESQYNCHVPKFGLNLKKRDLVASGSGSAAALADNHDAAELDACHFSVTAEVFQALAADPQLVQNVKDQITAQST